MIQQEMNPPLANPQANNNNQVINIEDDDWEDDRLEPDVNDQAMGQDQAAEDKLIGVVSVDESSTTTHEDGAGIDGTGDDAAAVPVVGKQFGGEQFNPVEHNPPAEVMDIPQGPGPVAPNEPPPPPQHPGSPDGHGWRGRFADAANAHLY